MPKFTDTMTISVKAGHGGAGAVSFHREKYVPRGGPDGGDGGAGGSVYLEADRRFYNLSHLFPDRIYKAEKGHQGMGANRHGANGKDLTIKVPPGTIATDPESDEVLADLIEEGVPFLVAQGGIGGKGNAFFKSSTHQTPRFAQPGMPGEERDVHLNLKLIADIGLVGLPNAGKSTLLAALTAARPKIGDYPFTTLIPNLGVLEYDDRKVYTIADIPGIIEGAHKGHGLGLSFLQHIERVKVILYVVDAAELNGPYTLQLLRSELETYNSKLPGRPSAIVLTKTDLVEDDLMNDIRDEFPDETVVSVSSHSGKNLDVLLSTIRNMMEKSNAA